MRLAVSEDLGGLGVLLLRDVADLLEQREVHVRLDVAGGARIAVPVPRAAEVTALLDQTDVVDAGLPEPGSGEQTAEAAADDQHLDVVVQRAAFERRHVRIVEVALVLAGDLDVLLVAVGAQTLVALLSVLLTERIRIERGRGHLVVVAGARGVSRSGVRLPGERTVRCHRGDRRPRPDRVHRARWRSRRR